MLFFQLLLDGVINGFAIGLVAVSFSLYYSTTGVFHVAHAGIYTLGGYIAWYLTTIGVPFWMAALVGIAGCAIVGAAIQSQIYGTLLRRRSSPLSFLIASLGLLYVLQNVVAALFTPNTLQFENTWRLQTVSFAGLHLNYAQILLAASGLLAFLALQWMSRRTLLGKRIRAVASNPFLAEITRLDPYRVYVQVMVIASAVAATAGIMVGLDQAMQPYTGVLVLLTATIAVIAGGIGSLTGAFLTAMTLAVLQNLSLVVMSGRWSIAWTFGLFIIFILIRPTGLFRAR